MLPACTSKLVELSTSGCKAQIRQGKNGCLFANWLPLHLVFHYVPISDSFSCVGRWTYLTPPKNQPAKKEYMYTHVYYIFIYVCIHRVYYMYYVHNPIPLIFNTPILWSQLCGNPRLSSAAPWSASARSGPDTMAPKRLPFWCFFVMYHVYTIHVTCIIYIYTYNMNMCIICV